MDPLHIPFNQMIKIALLVLIISKCNLGNSQCALIVSNTNDSGVGSLRDAVACASNGDTITFDNSINGMHIKLTSGQISIDKDLSFLGNGMDNTIVDGSNDPNDRLFDVNSYKIVRFEGMTFKGGGSESYSLSGGAIETTGVTLISNCRFKENNSKEACAIRVWNGRLWIVNSEFIDNGKLSSGTFESLIYVTWGDLKIHQNLFHRNDISRYGIIDIRDGTLDFRHNTISQNIANSAMIFIGYTQWYPSIISYNIFDETEDILLTLSDNYSSSSNLLQHADADLPASNGNYVGLPAFVNPNTGDFSLTSASAAIDKGISGDLADDFVDIDNNGIIWESIPFDYSGNSRVTCSLFDIGAYEYPVCTNTPCNISNLVHTQTDNPMGIYEILQSISSSTTIQLPTIYQAETTINILPNFETTPGQLFEAKIESPCNPNN